MKVRKAVAVIVHRISPKIWKQIDFVLFLEYKSKSYCLKLDPMNHSDLLPSLFLFFLPRDWRLYALISSCCCLIYEALFPLSVLQAPKAIMINPDENLDFCVFIRKNQRNSVFFCPDFRG